MDFRNNNEYCYNNFRDKLTALVITVERENCLNLQSLNIHAEIFYAEFLNLLFGWQLQNANAIEQNAQGIDLIDHKNRIVVQVSSTTDRKKVQESLDKSAAYKGYRFYFVAIANKLPKRKEAFQVPEGIVLDPEGYLFSAAELERRVLDAGIDKKKSLSDLMDRYFSAAVSAAAHDIQLCACLDRILRDTRETHPSFKLMQPDKLDERLFPGIKAVEAFETKGRRDEDGKAGTVWGLIAESWKNTGNRSIVIEGEGGIGKTVTLLSPSVPLPAPALYLHLYELAEGGKTLTLPEYLQNRILGWAAEIDRRATQPREDGPALILLLDGFNEIPTGQRCEVLKKLNGWRLSHPGAQFIAVSRPLDGLNLVEELAGRPIGITLKPLDESDITGYLNALGVPLPTEKALWDILGLPLFLTLYARTKRIQETENSGYPLAFKEARSKGAVIWNYLQRELLRKRDDENWVLSCALACEYILPRIAWEMERNGEFDITQEKLEPLIEDSIRRFAVDKLPFHLFAIWDKHRRKSSRRRYPDLGAFNWGEAVWEDSGLLRMKPEEENDPTIKYSFPHQIFRDCLAGLYLVNQAEMAAKDTLPKLWRHTPNHLALPYAAELMDAETAEKLWEANRVQTPTDRSATYAQLELELRLREAGAPRTLNFSGMDLRGLSLTRYGSESGHDLALFRDPALSERTMLGLDTFRAQGHTGRVTCLALTDDGLCVSGSYDHTLRVWDLRSGECLHTLEGHKYPVTCLAVTPDGRCVSGSDDHTLRVWDLRSGKRIHTLEGHEHVVRCLAVTPDGRCVSGSYDHTLRVWDLRSGQCLHTLEGHSNPVTCLAVTDDGRCVSGSGDHTLRVWDLRSGHCLHTLEGHSRSVTCLAVTPDGLCISGSRDNTLRVWDLRSGHCLHTLQGHSDWVTCLAVTPDGLCISGSDAHTLRVWDLRSGHCLHTLEGHSSSVSCLAVTDDGLCDDGLCVSGSYDNTLRVWDLRSGECLHTLEGHSDWVTCLAVTDDGLCVSGSLDNTLRVWDLRSSRCLHTLQGHSDWVRCLTVTDDGRCVSGSGDHTLRVWDLRSGHCLHTLEGHSDWVRCLAVTPDGRCVSGSDDNTLRVWDLRSGHCLHTLKGHSNAVTCLAVTDDSCCVSGSWDNTLRVWDLCSGQCLHTLEGHSDWVNCLAVTDDGRCVSGSWDNTLRVWDLRSGHCLHTLQGHSDWVTCLAVTDDGRCVSGSDDNTLRVWDLRSGHCLHTLKGHSRSVTCLAVTDDGRCVSRSRDNTLRVWDLRSGQCLHTLEGHSRSVTCLAVTPDSRCVSVSWGHTLRVWDLRSGQCLHTLEGHSRSVTCLAVTDDGRCVSGSRDGTLCVWDMHSWRWLDVLRSTEIDVSAMNFSKAILSPDLARALWQNGAALSPEETKRQERYRFGK